MKRNVSYVGMHECYMDFMQKMHEKNAFFMDKKTSSDWEYTIYIIMVCVMYSW